MKKLSFVITAALLLLPLFICCSSHSENTSFLAQLDEIDSYILYSDTKEAVKALKQAQKSAYSLYDKFGIYKRFLHLGEEGLAEEVLIEAHKAYDSSPLLLAVHSKFLLDHGRLFEASVMSYPLRNTEYASFFSECAIKTALAFNDAKLLKNVGMVDVYRGAWLASHYGPWLRNAACILMERGDYDLAAKLFSADFWDERDVMFWGSVLYDAGLFKESLDCLLSYAPFVNSSLEIERLALEADNYHILDENESAEKIRSSVIDMTAASYVDSVTANKFLTKIYMNRALYATECSDKSLAFSSLYYLLENFKSYAPALALYGRYALKDDAESSEDELSLLLRSFGLRTLEMEVRDSIPKAACDDAMNRIQEAVNKEHTTELCILQQQFINAVNAAENEWVTRARVWSFLEGQDKKNGFYSDDIVEYVLSVFCGSSYESEGEAFFYEHIQNKYGTDFALSSHTDELELWELLFGAYFAIKSGNVKESLALYGCIAKKFDEHVPAASSHNAAVVNAFVNLAVIYAGTNRDSEALEMLNKASWICADAKTKAEVLYRMAKLSNGLGDVRNALRLLQYAIELNTDHRKARLLLKTLNAQNLH